MPVPKTFSAPGEEFTPAVEDSLRYGGWLAHMADNLMWRRYANDRTKPNAGARIVQSWRNRRVEAGITSLWQLIITHEFLDSIYAAATAKRGVKKVKIGALHVWPYDSRAASNDVDADELTANAVAERSERIFMRGTLAAPTWESNRGIIIDPFRSPRFTAEDAPEPELIGAYDPDRAVRVNDMQPLISRRTERVTRREVDKDFNPFNSTDDEWMVIYGVYAEYEVQITDSETMSAGGPLG